MCGTFEKSSKKKSFVLWKLTQEELGFLRALPVP